MNASISHFKVLWQKSTDDPIGSRISVGYDGSLYTAGSRLTRWSSDGELLWNRDLGDARRVLSNPVMSTSGLLHVSAVDGVRTYNINGELIWTAFS